VRKKLKKKDRKNATEIKTDEQGRKGTLREMN
jgi:hypothetical protein